MGFYDVLGALGAGLSTGAQAYDTLQQRERQQEIDEKDREERTRLRALEQALMELNLDQARAGPQPTYGVGAAGRPTMSGARDPGQVSEFMERYPVAPETPDPPSVSVRRPTAGGDYTISGTPDQIPGLVDALPPRMEPPENVSAGERRSDAVINNIVSGFRSETMDHRDAASGYAAMQGAYQELASGNPAAAIGMLFAYGKILDPGSVVREGELRTLQNIGAYDDRVKNWIQMAYNGTMTPEVAEGIVRVAENTMRQRQAMFRDVRESALRRGEIQGLSRAELEQIIPDYYRRFGAQGSEPQDLYDLYPNLRPPS